MCISASAICPASPKSLISIFSMKMRVGESRIAENPVQSGTYIYLSIFFNIMDKYKIFRYII